MTMAVQAEVAVDVGTFKGGSARGLSQFVDHVVTIDADMSRAEGVAGVDNIEFRHGLSWEVLPGVLDEYRDGIGLVIVDASHEFEDIQRDMKVLLDWKPARGVFVAIHDTAMPDCRAGLQAVDWYSGRWVHAFGIDWVRPPDGAEMAGLGLLWLDPVERVGPLIADVGNGIEVLTEPQPRHRWWQRSGR